MRFGIRGGLAASLCYLTYNLIAWPGISTAVATCLLTALTTVGGSRQKQILRFAGALVGGVILGFGCQLFVLPAIDSIAGFLILFLAVTIPAAWIAASGPRLSYFGVQIALAFYLINLQEFKFQVSLAVARDRLAGILLGLTAMWLVFDQLWGASAAVEMERTFLSTLRFLGRLMQAPISPNPGVAIGEIDSLRETINTNFDRLRHGRWATLEFGPSREPKLAMRTLLLRWQLQLRVLFVVRIALSKYRLRLPGLKYQNRSFGLNRNSIRVSRNDWNTWPIVYRVRMFPLCALIRAVPAREQHQETCPPECPISSRCAACSHSVVRSIHSDDARTRDVQYELERATSVEHGSQMTDLVKIASLWMRSL